MKPIIHLLLVLGIVITLEYSFSEEPIPSYTPSYISSKPLTETPLPLNWALTSGKAETFVKTLATRTFIADVRLDAGQSASSVIGAYLDLRYNSGLVYSELAKTLPGKKIQVDVIIPEYTFKKLDAGRAKVRLIVKSINGDKWIDLNNGKDWTEITPDKTMTLGAVLPERSVSTKNGLEFDPSNTASIAVEMRTGKLQGTENLIMFIQDIRIDNSSLDKLKINLNLIRDGKVMGDTYIPSYPEGTKFILTADAIAFKASLSDASDITFDGKSSDFFLNVPVHFPGDAGLKGSLVVTSVLGTSTIEVKRDLSEITVGSAANVSIPLDKLSGPMDLREALKDIDIKVSVEPEKESPPIPMALSPVTLVKGRLVTFSSGWKERDAQKLGGYKCVDDSGNPGVCGIAVSKFENDPYRALVTIKMTGGIDWTNPFYRAELEKEFENTPRDLTDTLLEIEISPVTDTTELWQTPYRARIGLLDMNGNIMFGPNISLSEGLPAKAYLNVTMSVPSPKGFTMPGFDPAKVKSLIINVEATQTAHDPLELSIMLNNLNIRNTPATVSPAFKNFDFSRFKRDPEKWAIKKLVDSNGGYMIGINYPFPTVKVSNRLLEVPEVYPTVGRKPDDPGHFGFSSPVTKAQTIEDLSFFASRGLRIVRIFGLGHLDGVFNWDMSNNSIRGFDRHKDDLIRASIEMPVEKYAEHLRKNEKSLFPFRRGITGLNSFVIPDLRALLTALEEVERKTGVRELVILVLYDFTIADGITKEGPNRRYKVGEHPEVVTDPMTRLKAEAIIWKMMRTIGADGRFRKYISAVEIMNEPSNAAAVVTPEHFADLVNMVGETMYLVKDAIGPDIPVTIGFASWAPDIKYWKTLSGGIDILMPHYWESLESYDIDTLGLWPLDTPAEKIWEYLGAEKNGRLTGMGEISPLGGKIKENLERLKTAGYDFSLVWSYSGHDGFDAKPVMDEISTPSPKRP
ncbi:MAG: hypothetical protein HQL30_10325 [Candidatus Omnitrophica bacterium]|nr:hypothetical protein [Candidatus Omnitrophota bacterium]